MNNAPAPRPTVLWCGNHRRNKVNGWAFPPKVERLLQELTAGRTVLQLFGGRAPWGTRTDIDATTRPHVLADAWLPPFVEGAFQDVILDPPYLSLNQQMKCALLRAAAFVARDRVFWFHTSWVSPDAGMRRERSWLVRVGNSCACRCLIEWRVVARQPARVGLFTRGPAMKYNRWLVGNVGLPLEAEQSNSVSSGSGSGSDAREMTKESPDVA